jgi:hypothetical protein
MLLAVLHILLWVALTLVGAPSARAATGWSSARGVGGR